MEIYSIIGTGYDSNIFVIPGKKPTVIDTGTGMHKQNVLNQIEKYIDISSLSQIILTHEHFDHTGGVKQLYDVSDNKPTIIAHQEAATKIERGESMFARMLGGTMPKMLVDQKVSGGESVLIGDKEYEIISTPGHTPGCICLYNTHTKTLFSGDTIFANGSFGRTDLPGGNSSELKQSIQTLSTLSIDRLYPGHELIVEQNAQAHVKMALKNVNYFG